ncbi:MAG: hypothetical protein M1829_006188 [Trizodia sp. TS-e1964]|nr:MAG: hypothetical protein M1829_006188 [Trizodia sp. TS-e1964]
MEHSAQDLAVEGPDKGGNEGLHAAFRGAERARDSPELTPSILSLQDTLNRTTTPSHLVASAAFRAMQGNWKLSRVLKSAMPTFPSGTFTGSASFHPRPPSHPLFHSEYLYIEEGSLVTEQGLVMKGSRRYVYRYNEREHKISAWFVKPDDAETVDYLFHQLEILLPEVTEAPSGPEVSPPPPGWTAKGYHLCVKDDYHSEYLFRFCGINLATFNIVHRVDGPNKSYITDTSFVR